MSAVRRAVGGIRVSNLSRYILCTLSGSVAVGALMTFKNSVAQDLQCEEDRDSTAIVRSCEARLSGSPGDRLEFNIVDE